jgi:hypothetical protein
MNSTTTGDKSPEDEIREQLEDVERAIILADAHRRLRAARWPTLAAKLAYVSSQMKRVPKNGVHQQGYTYVRASDAIDAVRDALGEVNVYLSFEPGETKYEGATTSQGKSTNAVETLVTMELECGDTGEKKIRKWPGFAFDSSDKALYKAVTGAAKYAHFYSFALASDDDPESHNQQDAAYKERPAAQQQQPRNGNGNGDRAAQAQRDADQAAEDEANRLADEAALTAKRAEVEAKRNQWAEIRRLLDVMVEMALLPQEAEERNAIMKAVLVDITSKNPPAVDDVGKASLTALAALIEEMRGTIAREEKRIAAAMQRAEEERDRAAGGDVVPDQAKPAPAPVNEGQAEPIAQTAEPAASEVTDPEIPL